MSFTNPSIFPALISGLACAMTLSASAATFEVDRKQTTIKVDAKATGHAFTGTLKDYQITAAGDAAKLKPTALSLSWRFKDLDTDDDGRDEEMIKWLGGGDPKGSYKFVKIWSKDGKDYAEGSLTIHGVTKTVQIPLASKKDGATVTVTGSTTINYKDFGLPQIRSMLVMTVDPALTVSFTLVGKFK
jgi:polyisoprenoid-binding protein YceI